MLRRGFDAEQIRALGDYTGTSGIETLARDTVEEHFATGSSDANKAARLVRITEHYVRMDYEGEGRASLYQVITGGEEGEILRQNGAEMHHSVRRDPVCGNDSGAGDASLLRPLDRRSRDALAAGEDHA